MSKEKNGNTPNNESKVVAKKDNDKSKTATDVRAGKLKLYSVSSFIILLICVLAVNIIFGLKIKNTSIDDYLTYDMTATGQNSVSSVTVSYLDSLPADTSIRIVGLMDRPTNLKDTPYEYVVPLLDDYVSVSNGKVIVEYIDPTKYPSIINELDPEGVYDLAEFSGYVVYNNGKLIKINAVDCFTYDQEYLQYGYYLPTSNIVEQKFTSAIVNLTQGYSYKAYFVRGLGEGSHDQLSNMLASMGIDSADIMADDSFTVPSDCDLLVLSGINADIPEGMIEPIRSFLSGGGKLIVAVDYTSINVNEPFGRLNQLLANYNIRIMDALIVENNPGYQLNNDPYNSLLDAGSQFTDMTSGSLRNSYGRPVTEADTPYDYITVYPVAATSSNASVGAYDESIGNIMQGTSQNQLYAGMYATFTGTPTPPEVYVFGTMTFTSDEYISSYGFNDANVVFLRNIVRNMLKADDSVYVEGKALSDYSIDTAKVNSNKVTILTFILVAVVPLAFVVAGVVIYNKRKNL